MNATAAADEVADLRHQRRDLRRELARVKWWRRLVAARRDLTLASLTAPDTIAQDATESAWVALAADAPTALELTSAVWPDVHDVSLADLDALDALDGRLDRYERRLSATLDSVTAHMVEAMGKVHRA
ncbi:hypothetical protein [Demequina sp.]|uniref:hypothetical protein n=1 Tax=Demequina sp. TaxID=2050685 RepID=UPI003D0AA364